MSEQWGTCAAKEFVQLVREKLELQILSLQELVDAREETLEKADMQLREDIITLRNQVFELLSKVNQLEQSIVLALGDGRNSGLLARIELAMDQTFETTKEKIAIHDQEIETTDNRLSAIEKQTQIDWAKIIAVCSGISAIIYAVVRVVAAILLHIK